MKLNLKDILSKNRYALPKTRLVSSSNKNDPLSEKLFGEHAKANSINKFSFNPLIAFCREYEKKPFTGDSLNGFATKFCRDFYLAPTDVGICSNKNLDLKNIIHLEDAYKILFETDNQTSKVKVQKDNYWAVSTFVINPLKVDPMKVISNTDIVSNIYFQYNFTGTKSLKTTSNSYLCTSPFLSLSIT